MLSTENAVIEILPGSANDSTAAEVYRKLYDLAHTDPQWMHTAPHHAQTRRPDEVRAARNPILRYDPS